MLPTDSHVHTEWSWDCLAGSMTASCLKAVDLGLRSIAFTEHTDFTAWLIPPEAISAMPAKYQKMVRADGTLLPPSLDVAGYLACVEECRSRFPGLRILSGLELGEPHWHSAKVRDVLRSGVFDRVLGSVHSLRDGPHARVVERLHGVRPPGDLLRDYLTEALAMVEGSDAFEVLGHLDYPVRAWPADTGPFAPALFEEEFRSVLRALAASGRVLEINTAVPLDAVIVRWWRECGGKWISFGSDAHEPEEVARDFVRMGELAEGCGFAPGRSGTDFWHRS
ncbi:PHP domain-containing protein [Streptomyces sp. NPDC056353]|uniref:PHP domain-containing protein n=1 Tax=unclassified Streptomyces TaxID=2593676 RepID=UPI0013C57BF7|nr:MULTISPECIES: PHP domain-containing protein [unclassified Streptomyces]NDZ71423.1 PHP domain-containing protein [Streptomyces sp. SID10362]QUW95255.1 Histidinol-phosphatase [Streptomyces sp. V17-9]